MGTYRSVKAPSAEEDQIEKVIYYTVVLKFITFWNVSLLQIVNGYFVHFFAPELPKLPKNVVFVIDISGSMSGRKIVQVRSCSDP